MLNTKRAALIALAAGLASGCVTDGVSPPRIGGDDSAFAPSQGPRTRGYDLQIDAMNGTYRLHKLRIGLAENARDDMVVRANGENVLVEAQASAEATASGGVATFALPRSVGALEGCFVVLGKRRKLAVVRAQPQAVQDYFIGLTAVRELAELDSELSKINVDIAMLKARAERVEDRLYAARQALNEDPAFQNGACADPEGEGAACAKNLAVIQSIPTLRAESSAQLIAASAERSRIDTKLSRLRPRLHGGEEMSCTRLSPEQVQAEES